MTEAEKSLTTSGEEQASEIKETSEDNLSITNHSFKLKRRTLHYTVTTGTIVLKEEVEEEGKAKGPQPKATMFFVAYMLDGIEDKSKRPITFSFNGGPGSSSVWLHLGLLGPRRVVLNEDGSAPPPPYRLEDNQNSLLDVTDLVFIDPVSTGFSRAVSGEKPKDFHNFKKDIESVGEFIRLFTSRYRRWTSPIFLIGESYGTTRAAGVAGYLLERHGMYLSGLMLVSSVLNFQTIRFNTGNDLPYIFFLPTYAATAWYHQCLPADLQEDLPQLIEEVKDFAMGPYTQALMKGSSLLDGERQYIIERLARYTGLSETFIRRSNLRIDIFRFVKELLRERRRTIGRLDSRFMGIDRDAAGENFEYDPSYASVQGPYSATLNDYVRGELSFESDLSYEVLSDLWQNWRFEEHQNEFVDVAETLRKAISMNPAMQVFVANGYYDLATPFLATEYTFDHMHLDQELRDNIVMAYYEAGHMMYIHQGSLAQMKKDLDAFIKSAVP